MSTASMAAETIRPTLVRWRIVALLFGLYTINCIDRIALSVGLPVIGKEFDLSGLDSGSTSS